VTGLAVIESLWVSSPHNPGKCLLVSRAKKTPSSVESSLFFFMSPSLKEGRSKPNLFSLADSYLRPPSTSSLSSNPSSPYFCDPRRLTLTTLLPCGRRTPQATASYRLPDRAVFSFLPSPFLLSPFGDPVRTSTSSNCRD